MWVDLLVNQVMFVVTDVVPASYASINMINKGHKAGVLLTSFFGLFQ